MSKTAQTITLELPEAIKEISASPGKVKAAGNTPNQRQLTLPAGQSVTVIIGLK